MGTVSTYVRTTSRNTSNKPFCFDCIITINTATILQINPLKPAQLNMLYVFTNTIIKTKQTHHFSFMWIYLANAASGGGPEGGFGVCLTTVVDFLTTGLVRAVAVIVVVVVAGDTTLACDEMKTNVNKMCNTVLLGCYYHVFVNTCYLVNNTMYLTLSLF